MQCLFCGWWRKCHPCPANGILLSDAVYGDDLTTVRFGLFFAQDQTGQVQVIPLAKRIASFPNERFCVLDAEIVLLNDCVRAGDLGDLVS